MLCVAVDGSGAIVVVDPQPVEVSGCSLVVQSAADAVSPFALSPEQGGQISVAILSVWSVAYVFRLFIRTLSTVDELGGKEL